MGQTQAVCPHCGHDFPPPPEPGRIPGWVYLGLTAVWVALLVLFRDNLVVGTIISVLLLGCLVVLVWRGWRLVRGD